jgi:MFS family permease
MSVPGAPPSSEQKRPGLRESFAVFRYRNFRWFFGGAVISSSGTWAQNATVFFILEELTDSTVWAGFGSLMAFGPATLMAPLGGYIADRYHRRMVLLVTQSAAMVAAAAMWLLWVSGRLEPWSVVAISCVSGLIAGLNIASWQAFITELVPRSMMLNAVTLNSTQFNIARGLGPLVAGLMIGIDALGISWALALNPVSYLAVLFALTRIHVPRIERPVVVGRPQVLRNFGSAIAYVRRVPGIMACVVVIVFVGFLGSPIFSFLPKFNDDIFQAGDRSYALLIAAQGLGGIAASPFVPGLGKRMPRSRLISGALLLYGGSIAVVGFSSVYVVGVVALFAAGAAYLTLASSLNTTIQLQVDESMRGKVLAFYVMCLTASLPLGAQLLGFVAETPIGLQVTVGLSGLVLVGVTLVLRMAGRFAPMDDETVATIL